MTIRPASQLALCQYGVTLGLGTKRISEVKAIPHSRRTSFITRRMLIRATTLSVVAILGIVGYLLVREYRNTEQDATRSALNLVQLINRDIRNTFSIYDSALTSLIDFLQSRELSTLPSATRQSLLFARANEAPSNAGFFVLDAAGQLIASSAPGMPVPDQASQQPWFKAHLGAADDKIFISRPFLAGQGTNDWNIILSRRVSGPEGDFRGVAVGQIKLSYFQSMFRGLDIGPTGNISLVSADGILLTQYPGTNRVSIGQDLSRTPNFIRFLEERHGSFTAMSGVYHQERLYNFAQVGELPLVVVVAISTSSIFDNWWHTALLIGSATLLLCLGLLWLTWLLTRELRLRHKAERVLAELAATDPLTGLANRRTLDTTLDLEWRRAQRSGNPVSLVMIDIDNFKAFNDCYGHQAGDEAIRRVAQVIKSHTRRPADLAARYGGEEFAVILTETEATGTRLLAEKIRCAVEQLEPVAEHRKLTISLGACSRYAKPGDDQQALISTADKALYQAKKGGRNRVVCINETGLNALQPKPEA
ncbi:diguanylate cyclase [Pseudomonas sp. Fl4BN2]|nr:diguanylate cyclase [Pseudomonas sp. Fl4BN2]